MTAPSTERLAHDFVSFDHNHHDGYFQKIINEDSRRTEEMKKNKKSPPITIRDR